LRQGHDFATIQGYNIQYEAGGSRDIDPWEGYRGKVPVGLRKELNMDVRVADWGRWARLIALFVSLCLAVALNVNAQSRLEGNGRVLGVDEEKRMLFLAHGPIPGFMPPMQHGFEVHQVELLRGLKKGDMIHFVLEVQNEILGISSIEKAKDGK